MRLWRRETLPVLTQGDQILILTGASRPSSPLQGIQVSSRCYWLSTSSVDFFTPPVGGGGEGGRGRLAHTHTHMHIHIPTHTTHHSTYIHHKSRKFGWCWHTHGYPEEGRSFLDILSCMQVTSRWSQATASLCPHSLPGRGSWTLVGIPRTQIVAVNLCTGREYHLKNRFII